MAVKQLCRFCGCTNYRVDSRGFCGKHLPWKEAREAERVEKNKERLSLLKKSSEEYKTSRWQKARRDFLKTHNQCAMCGAPATIVDHIIPHRGDMDLFYAPDNFQALCKTCHDQKTRSEISARRWKKS